MHQHSEYQRTPNEPMVNAMMSGFQWMKSKDPPPTLPCREGEITCADREEAISKKQKRKRLRR